MDITKKHLLLSVLAFSFIMLVVSACTWGVPSRPPKEGYSASSLDALLGSGKEVVADAFGVDLDIDAEHSSVGTQETYMLIDNQKVHDKDSVVMLLFNNKKFLGYRFVFDPSQGDSDVRAGFDFAKKLRSELIEKYGQPILHHSDSIGGPEDPAELIIGKLYHDEWEVKSDAKLAADLFGEDVAKLWNNRIFITLILEANGSGEEQFARVTLQYSPPTFGTPDITQ